MTVKCSGDGWRWMAREDVDTVENIPWEKAMNFSPAKKIRPVR